MANNDYTNINAVSSIDALTANDKIFVSDEGNYLKRIDYTKLAKAIIEQYNGSSLMGGTSTIQAAFNTLNNKDIVGKGTLIPSGANLDTYTTIGKYYATSSTNITNCPTSAYGFSLYVMAECASQIKQMIVQNTYVTDVYVRQRSNSGTWGDWDHIMPRDVTHPDITDVLTPASDVTIVYSYVSVRDGLLMLDCNFKQTSTTKTDRFTFKVPYKPDVLSRNIAPVFMYSNNAVSNCVLFINQSTITIFGGSMVANQDYFFRLMYFIK